jgi:hypothetical protein
MQIIGLERRQRPVAESRTGTIEPCMHASVMSCVAEPNASFDPRTCFILNPQSQLMNQAADRPIVPRDHDHDHESHEVRQPPKNNLTPPCSSTDDRYVRTTFIYM